MYDGTVQSLNIDLTPPKKQWRERWWNNDGYSTLFIRGTNDSYTELSAQQSYYIYLCIHTHHLYLKINFENGRICEQKPIFSGIS